MLSRVAPSAALALMLVSASGAARADGDDKDLATELFAKGNKLMEAGKCDQAIIGDRSSCVEARDNFQKAYEIYPAGLGALRNLAYVERGLGRYASAARRFRELQQKAPNDPNPKRHVWAEYAAKELEVIEPLIPHLTVKAPDDAPTGLAITVDGKPLPQPAWGTSVEIDPGAHKVHAEGAGVAPFDESVTLANKENKTVTVVFTKPVSAPPPVEKPKPAPSRTVPLIVAGVGAVTMIVGLGFGYAAISGKKDACGSGKVCEPEGLDDARSYAVTSNILTGAGAAVLIGGAAWYFLTPSGAQNKTGVNVVPFAGGAALVGRF